MQHINFVTQFFLEILQRYWVLVISSTLSMLGHTHQKWKCQFIDNCNAHLLKKSTSSLTFILKYCKDFAKNFG